MNQPEPDNIPEYYTPDEMSDLVRVLGEAGWLTGKQFVDGNRFQIYYSPKGSQRMKAMGKLLKEMAPEFFGSSSRLPKPTAIQFAMKALLTAPELLGKIKTDGQGNALVGLIAAYARQYGLGE